MKQIVQYYRPDYGGTIHCAFECETGWYDEFPHRIAEDCAEDYHGNHDGWEANWPLKFTIVLNGENLGTFEIERKSVPQFRANKV